MGNIVLDSYAVLAFLFKEKGHEIMLGLFEEALAADKKLLIAAPNWAEVRYRVERKVGAARWGEVRARLLGLPIEIVDVDQSLAETAGLDFRQQAAFNSGVGKWRLTFVPDDIQYYISSRKGSAMSSTRTIITISDEEKRWLKSYSQMHRVSLAEAIRKGITCLKSVEGERTYKALVEETKGLWSRGDGLDYQKRLRSEWDPT